MDNIQESKSLNKYISETGICSRREADKIIDAGRVKINGAIAIKGNRVVKGDQVFLDGKRLSYKPAPIYLAFNKPVGIVCTTDLKQRHNIINYLKYPERLFPIGRLDKPSEGLIFLTNDGDIVNKILRAGNAHEKEYIVTIDKPITSKFLSKMANGLPILGTITKPCKVKKIGNKTFKIILIQGLNRQIRRMCEHLGCSVTRLQRTRIMNVNLDSIKIGKYRDLTKIELNEIFRMVKNSSKTA